MIGREPGLWFLGLNQSEYIQMHFYSSISQSQHIVVHSYQVVSLINSLHIPALVITV